jgi:hypothetical protein
MSRFRRQKACIACANSKRRCDKGLPECGRCLDKDIECLYPQPKRQQKVAHEGFPEHQHVHTDTVPDIGALDFGDWGPGEFFEPSMIMPNMVQLSMPSALLPYASISSSQPGSSYSIISQKERSEPWFMREETWVMEQTKHGPSCGEAIDLESFIPVVEVMLQCWLRNGHNSFIHQRLYKTSMPICMQDAFTTLATYNSWTPATTEMILQIAIELVSALTVDVTPTTKGRDGLLQRLARVQSLFIYEFILLFDGSVRSRAAAESYIPILREWVTQLLGAVLACSKECFVFGHHTFTSEAIAFEEEYETACQMWQLWILTESIRRTHLIIDTVANRYQIMGKELAQCRGTVMCTARRGLWDAESAIKWYQLCSAKPPLLIPSLTPEPSMAVYAAGEFGEFATLLWGYIVGQDRIKCWIDRG